MPYDNIKSHKRPGFYPLFRRYIFRKPTGCGGQIDAPSRFRAKGHNKTKHHGKL